VSAEINLQLIIGKAPRSIRKRVRKSFSISTCAGLDAGGVLIKFGNYVAMLDIYVRVEWRNEYKMKEED